MAFAWENDEKTCCRVAGCRNATVQDHHRMWDDHVVFLAPFSLQSNVFIESTRESPWGLCGEPGFTKKKQMRRGKCTHRSFAFVYPPPPSHRPIYLHRALRSSIRTLFFPVLGLVMNSFLGPLMCTCRSNLCMFDVCVILCVPPRLFSLSSSRDLCLLWNAETGERSKPSRKVRSHQEQAEESTGTYLDFFFVCGCGIRLISQKLDNFAPHVWCNFPPFFVVDVGTSLA